MLLSPLPKRSRAPTDGPQHSYAFVIAEAARRLLFNRRHNKIDRPPHFARWEMLKVFRDKCEELGWSLRSCRVYLGHRRTDPGTPDWTEPKEDEGARPVLMVRVPLAALMALVMSVEKRPL